VARPALKKASIERAALELFAEVGIDGASIRMIADRAGVTEGALYRHHASKDDLVRALFFRYFESYADMMAEAMLAGRDLEGRLRAMVEGFFAGYDADPKSFHFVLLAQHRLLDEVRRDMRNPVEVIVAVLHDALHAGEIPEQDVAHAAQMLMGVVVQTAVGHRYGRITGPLKARVADVVQACLSVLRRRVSSSGAPAPARKQATKAAAPARKAAAGKPGRKDFAGKKPRG